ncbi:MAG: cob(I)yrinic acid a,c-diamide adenosyltransferase [Spirochaetaceae bacterium]|jgi:cob(I)alamin adenosyltransferase|nr:cob(I)yrinic acid a,c-diamide adenosyltransferase [Spirochaetaceae bacterium]
MIHLYYGNGKGKTTAVCGLAVRFAAHVQAGRADSGAQVIFAQFLKGGVSGEVDSLRALGVRVVRQEKRYPFTFQMNQDEKTACAAEQARIFAAAAPKLPVAVPSLLVLDEIIDALETGMLERAPVELFLRAQGPESALEIALTGHSAPDWLREYAAYITEFKKIRHPFDNGVKARAGIEF